MKNDPLPAAPASTETTDEHFDEWAKVELFGHTTLVGRVTKAPIGDFLRVDVPRPDGAIAWTKFVNPKAVYAITPVTRELCLRLVERLTEPPVARYELPAVAPAVDPDDDPEDRFSQERE